MIIKAIKLQIEYRRLLRLKKITDTAIRCIYHPSEFKNPDKLVLNWIKLIVKTGLICYLIDDIPKCIYKAASFKGVTEYIESTAIKLETYNKWRDLVFNYVSPFNDES